MPAYARCRFFPSGRQQRRLTLFPYPTLFRSWSWKIGPKPKPVSPHNRSMMTVYWFTFFPPPLGAMLWSAFRPRRECTGLIASVSVISTSALHTPLVGGPSLQRRPTHSLRHLI